MPYSDPAKQKQAQAKHYEANKASYVKRNQQQRALKRQWVDSFKAVPCADCNQTYPPIVMDFHHDNQDKEHSIGTITHKYGREILLKEINKCVVLCANCHRLRHLHRDT